MTENKEYTVYGTEFPVQVHEGLDNERVRNQIQPSYLINLYFLD